MLRVILPIPLLAIVVAAIFGQTPPASPAKAPPQAPQQAPTAVDAALRARVTQFYDLEVQGKFNQALQLVAEDTKDLFVGTSKPSYQSFQMHGIRYSDDFTKAEVIVLVNRLLPIEGFMGRPLLTKIFSRWKIENGQWCFYVDPQKDLHASPFAPLPPPGLAPGLAPGLTQGQAPAGATSPAFAPPASIPPGLPLPSMAPPPAGVTPGVPRPLPPMPANLPNPRELTPDKTGIHLKSSGPSSDQVTILNATPWVAALTVSDPKVAGLSVKLDPLTVRQGQKAVLSIQSSADFQIPKTPITIIVKVQRTNQIIPVQVSFVN
ncbi:MAG TPA: hypothetical protein VMQ86_14925 [Bryobacteraceae bacterium]|nr:hypothetical protein [Bryobacteraceae bacterium]